MFKRVSSYGVVGLLVVALIGGTAYILLNREENGSRAALSEGRGRGNETESEAGSSEGRGRGSATVTEVGLQGGGNGGSNDAGGDRGRGSSSGGSSKAAEDITWETVLGTVVAADGEVTLQTAEGEIAVGMGQASYWEGFGLEVGHEVSIIGFYEDGEFKAGTVKNLTSGESIVLRDEAGRPMWSGQGRSGRQG